MSSVNEQEQVIAALALEYDIIDPVAAVNLIRDARAREESPLSLGSRLGLFSQAQLLGAIGDNLDVQVVDLTSPDSNLTPDHELLEACDTEWLERQVVLPLRGPDGTVHVVAQDPTSPEVVDYMSTLFPGYTPLLASGASVRQLLLTETSNLLAAAVEDEAPAFESPGTDPSAPVVLGVRGPVPDWIDSALAGAAAMRSSDLHFETTADGRMFYRVRVDGTLVQQQMPLVGKEDEVLASIMSRAGMRPENRKDPQDGSFTFLSGRRRIDVRASMMPLVNGQPKIVLRLLDPGNLMSLEELGYTSDATTIMRRAGGLPQGLVVVAGPTGSGKTTTLYALIQELITPEKNVMTIEDPVEYRLSGVSQIQVREDRGEHSVTFPRALRGILRLDPDIILVGEIRDAATAKTALEAALTGHLVLTTLHASSAIGVFTRLIELGAPPYLVAEAVSLAVSQRLVRRVHSCAVDEDMTPATAAMLERIGITPPTTTKVTVGCNACGQRGYLGRVAVATLSVPNAEMRALIGSSAPAAQIEAAAANARDNLNMEVQLQRLLDEGVTTPAEAVRATSLGDV